MEEGEEGCELGVDEEKHGEPDEKKILKSDVTANVESDIIETDTDITDLDTNSDSKPYYCQDVQVNGKGPIFRVTLTLVGTIFLPNAEGNDLYFYLHLFICINFHIILFICFYINLHSTLHINFHINSHIITAYFSQSD